MANEDAAQADAEGSDGAAPEIEGGAYEIIRARLVEQSKVLGAKAEKLNADRIEVFGGIEMTVLASERIRTENNCIPRDIVQVGGQLLFGYNVFLGLKKETKIEDVFSLQDFRAEGESFEFHPVALADVAWLNDPSFLKAFTELYEYYKEARLVQLRIVGARLLAVFQISGRIDDVKVFRWAISPDGDVVYIDNRGDEDHVFPASHDFEWIATGRDDFVLGTHPHVNILNEVFVEAVGGDLTVKIEDNTEDGKGIYEEEVDDKHQSLDDGQVLYAKVGALILIKILPYREETWRYLVFNTRTKDVKRIDNIGQACVQLPEDHGIIFPGGFYLQSGETKTFGGDTSGLRFLRMTKSPNGEDVMFAFYHQEDGSQVLLPYNLIRKEVENPITCHGSSIFADGTMVVFKGEAEPTRVHHTRIWQTAYMSDEVAAERDAASEHAGSFLVKVGNPELVRGISDCQSIRRGIQNQQASMAIYEDLISFCQKTIDGYHWLESADVGDLLASIQQIKSTAELVIDEFEKVLTIKKAAAEALAETEEVQDKLFDEIRPDLWETVDSFVDAMARLRVQRGRLITLKEMRYMDTPRVEELENQVSTRFDELSEKATEFLLGDDALKPYHDKNDQLMADIEAMTQANHAGPITETLDLTTQGLDVLTEVISGLSMDDPTARTQILEAISEVFALLNRTRATMKAKRKELMYDEGVAEFGAQFKLFGQSVQSGIGMCDTPEKCDEQLTRLMVQLEELEGRFSEFDEFLSDLAAKREETYDAFTSKKQTLLEARQRRASNLGGAAERILKGIGRRAQTFKELDDLNAYFAADPMVLKVRDIAEQLFELGDTVKSDESLSNLKKARDDATRQLRDKSELFTEGDNIIRLGKHLFSVNTQALELTMLPREGELFMHLTGTGYFEQTEDARLNELRPYWDQALVSESADVYRAEYLAACMLFDADEGKSGLTLEKLHDAVRRGAASDSDKDGLLEEVRQFAQSRYDEGYDRGVHDQDAALILEKLLALYATSGLLRFAPSARALSVLFWTFYAQSVGAAEASTPDERNEEKELWARKARSLGRLRSAISHSPAIQVFIGQLAESIAKFLADHGIAHQVHDVPIAAAYLFEEIGLEHVRFSTSAEAEALRDVFLAALDADGYRSVFENDLRSLEDDLHERFNLCSAWLEAFVKQSDDPAIADLVPVADETVVLLLTGPGDRDTSGATSTARVEGLLGNHSRVTKRSMSIRLDAFLARLRVFSNVHVPNYHKLKQVRQDVVDETRSRLRLEEFKPRVLSSFVRNKLINDVYLPMVGDNLAKQMGAVGANKRTDLMGLLLLISPPGYGKTTLMEYIANRLGLVFMKVNGPSLGHEVTSLDPSEAPNATARQEVEKINLAFEMGNNVMLYLDDIQHTNPELLQKFISLCDGTRRVEGVYKGKTKTYDLRGKKFCVIMAGNPYTETGDKFQIPDMLANRADTYNLGDILGGQEETFALSYVENSLTSNPVLAPLAMRDQKDIYLFVRQAKGEEINTSDFKHGYSGVESEEIVNVLRKLMVCQDVLLKVNAEYIRSASQDDKYRTEPSFKLQGSYRNMNKLSEKVVAVMNDEELEQLVDDHYQGESQTLTTGAEMNVLKLQELRGRLTEQEEERWEDIKKDFRRNKMVGGDDGDPIGRVVNTLAGLSQQFEAMGDVISEKVTESNLSSRELASAHAGVLQVGLQQLQGALQKAAASSSKATQVAAQATQASSEATKVAAQAAGAQGQAQAEALAAQLAALKSSIDNAARASAQTTLDVMKAETVHRQSETEALMTHERKQHETELRVEIERFKAGEKRDDQRTQAVIKELGSLRAQVAHSATQNLQSQAQGLPVVAQFLPRFEEFLPRLEGALTQLGQAKLEVNVTSAPPPGISEAMAHQAKVLEASVVPLLRALKEGGLASAAAPGPAAASAGSVNEALAMLKELKERVDQAEPTQSGGVYRPFAPKPLGTRAKDD